jgi:hypothetical protein
MVAERLHHDANHASRRTLGIALSALSLRSQMTRIARRRSANMLMVPWAVVGATRTLAQSALPDAPQVHQRPASRRQRVHRITKRRS